MWLSEGRSARARERAAVLKLTGGGDVERIFCYFLQKRLRQVIDLPSIRFPNERKGTGSAMVTMGAAMLDAWGETVRSVWNGAVSMSIASQNARVEQTGRVQRNAELHATHIQIGSKEANKFLHLIAAAAVNAPCLRCICSAER